MMERVAFVYGFQPSELDRLDLDDLQDWAENAAARLKVGPFLIR